MKKNPQNKKKKKDNQKWQSLIRIQHLMESSTVQDPNEIIVFELNKMLLSIENTLLSSHRQREEIGIKKLYNSFFVMF